MMDMNRDFGILEAAKKYNGLPVDLDSRLDAVTEKMSAACAKITKRVVTSHDYLPGRIVFDEGELDAREYAEETDIDEIVGITQTTASITIRWVPGVGPAVVQTTTHRDHKTTTTDYFIHVDANADDYNGRRMLEAAEAVRTIDHFNAACLAYELESFVETREVYLSDLHIFAPMKTRLALDVDCDHRRGAPDATPYAHSEDLDAPGDRIAYLSAVVPDSDGITDGITEVIRLYDHDISCVSGMRVPIEVHLRTLTNINPTVTTVIGSPCVIDFHDYVISRRISEEIDECAYDEDDPEPDIYTYDPDEDPELAACDYDDDEAPRHNPAASYADFVGARPY